MTMLIQLVQDHHLVIIEEQMRIDNVSLIIDEDQMYMMKHQIMVHIIQEMTKIVVIVMIMIVSILKKVGVICHQVIGVYHIRGTQFVYHPRSVQFVQ